jgi:hypothetical protein
MNINLGAAQRLLPTGVQPIDVAHDAGRAFALQGATDASDSSRPRNISASTARRTVVSSVKLPIRVLVLLELQSPIERAIYYITSHASEIYWRILNAFQQHLPVHGDWRRAKEPDDKTPTTVSFAEFEANLPSEGWYKVTGAQLEMTEAMWVDENGKIGNIYIPARKKGSEMGAEQPVSVLVKVNDAALRSFLEKSRDVEKKSRPSRMHFW